MKCLGSFQVRGAVADYLGPVLAPATGRLAIRTPMHPSLARAYKDELEPFFHSHMLTGEAAGGFGILDTAERRAARAEGGEKGRG